MKYRPLRYVLKEVLSSYEKENENCCICAGVTVLVFITKYMFLLYILVPSRILANLITLLYILGLVGEIWTLFLVH
jgi:hypothetical protein